MIEIYGAPWCSYCEQAKYLCESLNAEYRYHDIDTNKDRYLEILTEKLGTTPRSIPQIFANDVHLPGGFQELQRMLVKKIVKNG